VLGQIFIGAHAFGSAYNLPVPLYLFVFGGAAIVFVSFLLILPTEVSAGSGRVFRDRLGLRLERSALQWFTLGFLVLMVIIGFTGSQQVTANIVPTIFWLLVWVAVPITCALVGDWTRYANPFIPIAFLAERRGVRKLLIGGPRLAWPRWLAWWPATVLFFLLVCGELIYNAYWTLPGSVALGIIEYALLTFVGAVVFGAEAWLERGEVFSVLFGTWGRLGWYRFGAPGSRGLLGGVWDTEFEATVSRVVFVLMLLVSISFDGLLSTPTWKNLRLSLPAQYQLGTWRYEIAETIAFLILLGIVWALFQGFAAAVARVGRLTRSPLQALAMLLPSMLPIAFGYLAAHNADYLAINGQLLMPLLANPAGFAHWPHLPYPFNSTYVVNINLVPTSVIWYSEVVLIVAVHIAALIIAHRHLTRAIPDPRRARLSEWPWIAAMVAYTMSSLWLLAQPVAK
jgi:hypothetical protein